MTDDIEVTVAGGVHTLRLARPAKKNALTERMYTSLADALAGGDRDDAIGVHLILGAPGVFTAGNDLGDFLATASGTGSMGADVLRFIRSLPLVAKPLVAAVDGPAIGVGTTLLFHCDLVYASPAATFATPFVDLALVPEAASSLLMPARLGYARAFEMLALGRTFTTEAMQQAGLVNAVLPSADLEPAARAAADALARKPREALLATRRLMRGDPAPVLARIDEEAEAFRRRLASPEARRAFEAFFTRSKG
ncbi:MAG: crotonase/enoyl-CoA hydratase family protein [Hyphomicrobium sp.]